MIVAITSGKGGTGKTLIATHLAEALARLGHRTTLVDADLDLANCAVLLNETPRWTLEDYLLGRCGLEELFHETEGGFALLSPSRGALASPREAMLEVLDGALWEAQARSEFVLLDTPAGLEAPVLWALDRAHLALVVLLGEPAAVSDSYRLIKHVCALVPDYPFALMVNGVDSAEEAEQVAARFDAIVERFLGRSIPYMGHVLYDPELRQAIQRQEVLLRRAPQSPSSLGFHTLAERLLHWRAELQSRTEELLLAKEA
jgi:flagellar biosynthesis protein FlhG